MRILSPALCAAAAIALPQGALAANIAFAQAGEAEEIEKVTRSQSARTETPGTDEKVRLAAELATAMSRGNTETFLLSTNARLTWAFAERWVSETRFSALYEESFDENTANKFGLFERVDRFVSERLSFFLAAGWERDPFAALDARWSGQLGAAFLFLEDRTAAGLIRNKIQGELGGYAAREEFMLPPNAAPGTTLDEASRDIVAARAAVSYVHGFSQGTDAGVEIEAIQDFVDTENFVFNDTAYVAAAIVEGLALKVSFTHRFDNLPASEELEKNDLLLTAGLVVSL